MPDFLGLVRAAARFSGTIDPRTVSTVDTGSRVGLLAGLVSESWLEIQNKYRAWRFLFADIPDDAMLQTGATAYTAVSLNIPHWQDWILGDETGTSRMTIWDPALDPDRKDESILHPGDYRRFHNVYERGDNRSQTGRPAASSVDTSDRLVVWPVPETDYRLSGTYRRSAQVLSADTDTPIILEAFHNAIVWRAVELLHQVDEADALVLGRAEKRATDRLADLRHRYLPVGSGLIYKPLGGSRTVVTQSRNIRLGR